MAAQRRHRNDRPRRIRDDCRPQEGHADLQGLHVYPRELEELLFQHPAVANAAVVGKRDIALGELPVAFVVRREGSATDPASILAFVNERVVPYKKLRDIRIVDHIPVSAAGKVLRRALREAAQRDSAAPDRAADERT